MKKFFLFTVLLFSAFALIAQTAGQPAPAAAPDPRLESLGIDLKAMGRILDLAKNVQDERPLLLAFINDNVDKLREPRGDGTYRWASLQRIEDGRVRDEKGINHVSTEQTLDTAIVSASRAFRLLVTVPEKRNLVSANNKVFVRNVVIDSTGFDGKTTRTELPVNVWVNPKDSHGIALPEIAKSAQASVELGVESGAKKAVAEISLLQAKLVDDPQSPYFPAIQRLQQIQALTAKGEIRRGDVKNVVDEAVLNLPGEMQRRVAAQEAEAAARKAAMESGQTSGKVAIGDATPDVVEALAKILTLSKGNVDEQTQSRTDLEQLLLSLRPPVVAAPVNK